MKDYVLRTSNGMREAISNLWYRNECTVAEIDDAVEDSKTGLQLVNNINRLKLLRKFFLDRETETKVRLKSIDMLGNISYFEAYK